MVVGWLLERAFQVEKPQCATIYQASACVELDNILLTKASHMLKPRVNVKGTTQGKSTGRRGLFRATIAITITIRMFCPISFAHHPQMSKITKEGAL